MFVIKIPNSWKRPSKIGSRSTNSSVALFTIPLLCLALYTTTIKAASSSTSSLDATLPVHQLRAAYEQVQSKSWLLIEQQWSSGPLSDTVKAKLVKELFVYHHKYITDHLADYERQHKDRLRTVFPEYNHFYEWNYVQGHINATNSLFDVFSQYLASSISGAASGNTINTLGARDFAETVLYDKKWPIEKSFHDIHHVMVGQGLYYKMATVLQGGTEMCTHSIYFKLIYSPQVQTTKEILLHLFKDFSLTFFFYSLPLNRTAQTTCATPNALPNRCSIRCTRPSP